MLTQSLLVLLFAAGSHAIVCTPMLCENVEQPELNCQGEVIKGGGFCGCTDVCAGVDGEACELPVKPALALLGVSRSPRCSDGYECVKAQSDSDLSFMPLLSSKGVCRPKVVPTTRRAYTQCEQTRMLRMISFAIWKGQWTPKCFTDGRFQPKQCDNTGACFCVTPEDGEVIVGSKKQSTNVQC
ncbi:uncharacterized protein [Watersipora subatra]|uniref:uncharacterized protein n=1 Tax=Watersipora subatra TaxID=2589382 RepID=UPI00355B234A